MRSETLVRFGRARGSPEHYFRVQVSLDGGRRFTDALVMKKDDRDGPSTPYRVEWAATTELEQQAEAALSRFEDRCSARDAKTELKKFLKGVPGHYVPPDAKIPVELDVRIAESRVSLGMYAGTEPNAWEQEADAAALRHAGSAGQASDEVSASMPKLFQWIPWFGELVERVREGRREGLVERAKEVDWAGRKCVVFDHGEQNADPLTFFSLVASVAGGQAEKREKIYSSIADVFEIESNLDYRSEDGFILPNPPAINLKFYQHWGPDRTAHAHGGRPPRGDSRNWDMFDQACALDGSSYGAVNPDTFDKVLRIKGVGVPKLTQVLFLINPRAFIPFDENAVLPLGVGSFKKPPARMSWAEYVDEMNRIRAAFPGCRPYEINLIGYLWQRGDLPRKGDRWYQIAATDDGWRDFRDNNWIRQGGLGDTHRSVDGEVDPEPEWESSMNEPGPGDVVLVRSGRREGRGIGIVYRNDYREAEAAAKAATVGGKSLEDLRRAGSGFALVIHQNRGMPVRVKNYGAYQTVLRAAKSEVLRPAVDRLDVRFRADGRVVAYLTRERDAVVTEVQDGDDPAEVAARLGGPKLTEAIPRPQQSHRSGGIHGPDRREQDQARELPQKSHRNGRIHILWVNKKQAPLAARVPSDPFSRAGRSTCEAFAKSAGYAVTLRMLQPPPPPPPGRPCPQHHPLRSPGTGKTWHTVTRAVAIVESRGVSEVAQENRPAVKHRFQEHREAGRIEMVTFHQNTTYEDFVEGIRPVLTESRRQGRRAFTRAQERSARSSTRCRVGCSGASPSAPQTTPTNALCSSSTRSTGATLPASSGS